MALDYPLVALSVSLLALLYAALLWVYLRGQNRGSEKMVEISDAVKQGAGAFLSREYKVIAPIAVLITVLIYVLIDLPLGTGGTTAAGFALGATLSAVAGYVGMAVTVRTSSRTAEAAKGGLGSALTLAFRGGGVMGMAVVGLDLLGLSVYYLAFSSTIMAHPATLAGLGFGASLIAMFMRVSGGIYTKAADVGADLVGKVEAGIPEDDPRNPAVIADNVGDNVGDCAGMGADVYESYVVTAIAVMILGALPAVAIGALTLVYPLLIGSAGILGAIAGSLYVRKSVKGSPLRVLNVTLIIAAVVTIVLDFVFGDMLFGGSSLSYYLFASAIVGVLVVVVIENVANYFTSYSYSPVREIAQSSQTGAATNFLAGFSTGLTSTAPSALVLVAAIAASFGLGYLGAGSGLAESTRVLYGVYSTAIATMSMLSLTGVIMSIDSFGPITDNANGIVEMAGMESGIREVTDELDAIGNTTKATTKAFAVTSAALAAVAIFEAFQNEASSIIESKPSLVSKYASHLSNGQLVFSLSDPFVVIGLLVGGLLPFYFSSFLIKAVGRTAYTIVNEVRRQFKEIPGIMEGTAKPDYARCVGIVTSAAIRQLALPAVVAVATPLVVGFVLGPLALGGLLIGTVVSGVFLAYVMTNGGAAWDNAKKYIETGQLGGKGSDAHKAAVMGDTVGDPFKDTAGPAINSLIKVVNTISIVFISAIVLYALFV